jgi:hypothetical protein
VVLTLMTYGALFGAALVALPTLMQRFGSAPIAAAHGTSVSAAAATPNAVAHKTTVDRQADDRVPPRGRPL